MNMYELDKVISDMTLKGYTQEEITQEIEMLINKEREEIE